MHCAIRTASTTFFSPSLFLILFFDTFRSVLLPRTTTSGPPCRAHKNRSARKRTHETRRAAQASAHGYDDDYVMTHGSLVIDPRGGHLILFFRHRFFRSRWATTPCNNFIRNDIINYYNARVSGCDISHVSKYRELGTIVIIIIYCYLLLFHVPARSRRLLTQVPLAQLHCNNTVCDVRFDIVRSRAT